MVKELPTAGADIEARGEHNQTALHIAAEVSNESVVRVLLDHNADYDAWMGNDTPLHRAAIVNKVDNGRALIKAGVPWDQESKLGDQAIHLAALKAHSAFIGMLLDHGADIYVYNRGRGSFPLLTAAAYGQTECVKYILTKSPILEQRTLNGDNPLILACWNQHIDNVKLLLKAGAEINTTSEAGISPLHCAVSKNNLEITRVLVESGVDLTLNTYQWRPLETAENLKFEEMAKILRNAAK